MGGLTRERQEYEVTRRERVFAMLDANPDFTASSVQKMYKSVHGIGISWAMAIRHMQEWKDQHKSKLNHLQNGELEAKNESVPDLFSESPGDPSFVPQALLDNIAHIKSAVDAAGGYNQSEQVAKAIEEAGGVSNFRRAIDLLRTINPGPPVPVSVPLNKTS